MIKVNCTYCNNELLRHPYRIKRGDIHFCDRKCKGAHKSVNGGVIVNCNSCDKKLKRYPYDIRRSKKHYCNNKCRGISQSGIKTTMIQCAYCSEVFEKLSAEVKRSKNGNHFCCREHYNLYKGVVGNGIYKCSQCNKEFIKSESLRNKNEYNFCSRKCFAEWRHENLVGDKNPNFSGKIVQCAECNVDIFRAKYRIASYKNHYCSYQCRIKHMVGPNAGGYKGASRSRKHLVHRIRSLSLYLQWVKDVLKRDDYCCQECNATNNLHVHHIKELIMIMNEYNITSVKEARACVELWNIDNGLTLCVHCHAEKHPDMREIILKKIA